MGFAVVYLLVVSCGYYSGWHGMNIQNSGRGSRDSISLDPSPLSKAAAGQWDY